MSHSRQSSCSISTSEKILHDAINKRDLRYVEQAIDAYPSLLHSKYSYLQYSPLHIATARGNQEILAFLLERGGDINARDRYGRTPLIISCINGRWACLRHLLASGANVLIHSFYMELTCLHYASKAGHVDSVQQILTTAKSSHAMASGGTKQFVNLKNKYGETALHLAAWKGHHDVVSLLLEDEALVSATTYIFYDAPSHGSTPLHFAARSGSIGCVQELLAWGADRDKLDSVGCTPYNVAVKHRNFACATLLDPHSIEPLVWPSRLKFLREISVDVKVLLEFALIEANKARQVTYVIPEALNKNFVFNCGEKMNGTTKTTSTISYEEKSQTTISKEMCCICFEEPCTIQIKECGHQMCAVCTIALCCHSKPSPSIPNSPPPCCPFCRCDISHIVLANDNANLCLKGFKLKVEPEEVDKAFPPSKKLRTISSSSSWINEE